MRPSPTIYSYIQARSQSQSYFTTSGSLPSVSLGIKHICLPNRSPISGEWRQYPLKPTVLSSKPETGLHFSILITRNGCGNQGEAETPIRPVVWRAILIFVTALLRGPFIGSNPSYVNLFSQLTIFTCFEICLINIKSKPNRTVSFLYCSV
jgi:hypothetical protein